MIICSSIHRFNLQDPHTKYLPFKKPFKKLLIWDRVRDTYEDKTSIHWFTPPKLKMNWVDQLGPGNQEFSPTFPHGINTWVIMYCFQSCMLAGNWEKSRARVWIHMLYSSLWVTQQAPKLLGQLLALLPTTGLLPCSNSNIQYCDLQFDCYTMWGTKSGMHSISASH